MSPVWPDNPLVDQVILAVGPGPHPRAGVPNGIARLEERADPKPRQCRPHRSREYGDRPSDRPGTNLDVDRVDRNRLDLDDKVARPGLRRIELDIDEGARVGNGQRLVKAMARTGLSAIAFGASQASGLLRTLRCVERACRGGTDVADAKGIVEIVVDDVLGRVGEELAGDPGVARHRRAAIGLADGRDTCGVGLQ